MKKVIVTGANGFVGSATVRILLQNNVKVCAIVHNGNRGNLENHNNLEIITCNMENINNLPNLLQKRDYDTFYHFAWDGASGEKRWDYQLQLKNVEYSMNAMIIAKQIGCQRFIGAGSIIENETFMTVNSDGNKPTSGYIYGAAKTMFHLMGAPLSSHIGLDLLWGKITNAYGAGELSPRLVNTTLRKCLRGQSPTFTSGTQMYDFVYITDVARAFYLIGQYGKPFVNYTIGSFNAKPLKDFLIEMHDAVAPTIDFQFGAINSQGVDLPKSCFDTSQLYEDTGFKPEVSFSEGCKLTYNWLREVNDQ